MRGGAFPTYYAVPKSGELSALFERTCLGVKMTGVSKCLYFYAVAHCLGGILPGCQNVLLSKRLGVKISCIHNVRVSKRMVSKCPGVKMSGTKMSGNHNRNSKTGGSKVKNHECKKSITLLT